MTMPNKPFNKKCVLVHVGFSAFYRQGIGPNQLLKVLDDHFFSDGWAIPVINWPWKYWLGKRQFNLKTCTPGNGFFAKFVKNQPDSFLSSHPTHSVCFRGNIKKEIYHNHEESASPCGKNTPWEYFWQNNVSIILLGCKEESLTITHCAEEHIQPSQRLVLIKNICNLQTNKRKNTFLHGPYARPGPGRSNLPDLLKKNRDFQDLDVLGVSARSYSAEAIHNKMMQICTKYPGQKKTVFYWLFFLIAKKCSRNFSININDR